MLRPGVITLGIGAGATLTPFVLTGLYGGGGPGTVDGATSIAQYVTVSVALASGLSATVALAGDMTGVLEGAE